MDIKTYPEMNEKIPALLRMDTDDSGNPDKLSHYAAQLIEEQAAQLKAAEAREARLREGLGTIRAISRYEHCRGHIEEVMREANSIIRSLLEVKDE